MFSYKKNITFLSWVSVILWMMLIFLLSAQPADDSAQLSQGVTDQIVEMVEKINPSSEWDLTHMHHFIRKNAHFFIYLILAVLVMNALGRSSIYGVSRLSITLVICLVYALSDEFHQLYVPGRGAQLKDVGIDTFGSVVGILIYITAYKIIYVLFKKEKLLHSNYVRQ